MTRDVAAIRTEHDAISEKLRTPEGMAELGHKGWEAMMALRAEYKQALFDERIANANVDGAISLCGSQEVAGVIASLADRLTTEHLREILRDEWTRCEAHKPYREDFVRLFKKVGFVTDVFEEFGEGKLPKRLSAANMTIWRGNQGEDEPDGIAWTLNRKTAEFFARFGQSIRGQFLGLYDPDGVPTIWKATVTGSDVLAYFGGRSEAEVVVDPATLRNVTRVAEARAT